MSEAPRAIPEDALIVLPVRNIVLFPGTLQPLAIGRPRSQAAAQEAAAQEAVRLERPAGVLLQNKPEVEDPSPEDLHWVGASAVLRYVTTPEGVHHAIVKGLRRFRALQFLEGYPFLVARVEYVEETVETDAEIQGRAQALKQQALQALQLLPQVPMETVAGIQGLEEPGQIADVVASVLDIPPRQPAVVGVDVPAGAQPPTRRCRACGRTGGGSARRPRRWSAGRTPAGLRA